MECRQQISRSSVVTHKTNHVSTVLLYDIPIVSLYIEGQERLCLAQISNTLLKQFSYNEIHNRRVALGITCVQCTPVQLEILRRTGAMPVSSRRCGMITRREAERLCKSFLGDNAPPRLPDDFAFSVYHKCAWGCRGSFLPSRYNSSRAKCIKCTLCGIFFSPNKFIFHSHRICASDKYIQPDAANFNSWRRHMILSGQPHEEIVHAWEDVKAMFNGGTRKRLMSSHSSMISSTAITATNKNQDKINSDIHRSTVSNCTDQATRLSPKRPDSNVGAVAAVVGVTAVTQQVPIRPFNMGLSSAVNANLSSSTLAENDVAIMPFSRSFMMDYMWHTHTVHSAAHIQHPQNRNNSNVSFGSAKFPFPANCGLQPWIKAPGANGTRSHLFGAATTTAQFMPVGNGNALEPSDCVGRRCNTELSVSAVVASSTIDTKNARPAITSLPHIFNSSAFKPVMQKQKIQHNKGINLVTVAVGSPTATTVISTCTYSLANSVAVSVPKSTTSSSSPSLSSSLSSPSIAPTSVASPLLANQTKLQSTQNALLKLLPPAIAEAPRLAADLDAAVIKQQNATSKWFSLTAPTFSKADFIKEAHSSEDELNSECEEMIDIETTEDNDQKMSQPTHGQHTPCPKSPVQLGIRKYDFGNSMDEIDVDGDSERDNTFPQLEQNYSNRFYNIEQIEERKFNTKGHSNGILTECICMSSKPSGTIELVENGDKSNEDPVDNLLQKEVRPKWLELAFSRSNKNNF